MCLFIVKGGTNWQEVRESLDKYAWFEFSSLQNTEGFIFSQDIVEHLAISFKQYELDPSITFASVSVVLIHEMGVFTSSNTSDESGGLFMHTSLKLLIVVIFTEHGFTISFIPMTLIRGTVFNHTREEKIVIFLAIFFIYFVV